MKLCNNIDDFILITIFYYIINKNYINMLNNNFIITFNLFKDICDDTFFKLL